MSNTTFALLFLAVLLLLGLACLAGAFLSGDGREASDLHDGARIADQDRYGDQAWALQFTTNSPDAQVYDLAEKRAEAIADHPASRQWDRGRDGLA